MPDMYAIFEGGGVKGIAHVGAYARTQAENLQFKGYAGSSAGAIVASLAAAGYNAAKPGSTLPDLRKLVAAANLQEWPGEMVQVMRKVNYLEFLDGKEDITLENIKEVNIGLTKVVRHFASRGKLKKLLMFPAVLKQSPLIQRILTKLFERKGLYDTGSFVTWMQDQLKSKAPKDIYGLVTFGSLYKADILLKIVATDLVNRRPKEFNYEETAGDEVAGAVQASMSIPLFFKPYALGSGFLVDGGLVSNFPAWVFEDELAAEDAVAIGYRLVQKQSTYTINSFGEYANALYHTALEGSDFQQTRGLNNLILIPIEISKEIPATKFDLTPEEQQALFFAGWHAADEVLLNQDIRDKLGLPQA